MLSPWVLVVWAKAMKRMGRATLGNSIPSLGPGLLSVKWLSGPGPLRFASCPTSDLTVPLTPTSAPRAHSALRCLPPPAQVFDDFIFIFFAMEMVLKMVALGIFGKKCYLGDTWNRLDFFIVMAG